MAVITRRAQTPPTHVCFVYYYVCDSFVCLLQVTELAGYTARVSEMLNVFEDMNEGIYHRSADKNPELPAEGAVMQHGQRVCGRLEIRGEEL